MNKRGGISQMIGGLVVVAMGVTMYPMVAEQVALATADPNFVDSPLAPIMQFVAPMFAIGIAFFAIMITYSSLRSFRGDVDTFPDTDADEELIEKPIDEEALEEMRKVAKKEAMLYGNIVYQREEKKKKKSKIATEHGEYTSVYQEGKTKFDEESF